MKFFLNIKYKVDSWSGQEWQKYFIYKILKQEINNNFNF